MKWGSFMRSMGITECAQRLPEVLDAVVEERLEVQVTRTGLEPVVLVPQSDLDALRETVYLLSHPANAFRLLQAMVTLSRDTGATGATDAGGEAGSSSATGGRSAARVVWGESAREDDEWWSSHDPAMHRRVQLLIRDITRHGHEGLGEPVLLAVDPAGFVSRRINAEHRLVYSCADGIIRIAACRYHRD